MTNPDDRSHSRSGPGSVTDARAAASGFTGGIPGDGAAAPTGDPLPMEPGLEYVAKADHDLVVEQVTAERDAMKGDLQRIAADFENFKRRAAAARDQASAAAETRLLGELLTVIDDTERAIAHAAQPETTKDAVVDGLRTVQSRLTGVAGSHGLERIDTSGTFDPTYHEAMMVQAAPNGEADDTILQVVESGWKIGDRVLRHARVIVAGGG